MSETGQDMNETWVMEVNHRINRYNRHIQGNELDFLQGVDEIDTIDLDVEMTPRKVSGVITQMQSAIQKVDRSDRIVSSGNIMHEVEENCVPALRKLKREIRNAN